MNLENVDLLKTKDLGDVSLAQILFDAIRDSSTGAVTLKLDQDGKGFIVLIPHVNEEGVH